MSKYKDGIKRLKMIQAALVILCIIVAAGYIYYITRPKVSYYSVPDECGPITSNQISHTIDDEDSCSNLCNAYCQSLEKSYMRSSFTQRDGPQCNLCECYCQV